jgi:hypothetical protein
MVCLKHEISDRLSDNDRVVPDQNLLDDETHDPLALEYVERGRGTTQAREERRESLDQAQEHGPVIDLIGDGLQLGAQRLLPLPQRWHSLAQLFERDELLLIGAQKPVDALVSACQFPLQALLTRFRGIGYSCRRDAAIEWGDRVNAEPFDGVEIVNALTAQDRRTLERELSNELRSASIAPPRRPQPSMRIRVCPPPWCRIDRSEKTLAKQI